MRRSNAVSTTAATSSGSRPGLALPTGTAVDITTAELSIEAFLPADQHTATVLRSVTDVRA